MKRRLFTAPLLAALLAALAVADHRPAPAARLSGHDAGSTAGRSAGRPVPHAVAPAVAGAAPTNPARPTVPAATAEEVAADRHEAWRLALPQMTGTYLPDVVQGGNSLVKRWDDRRDDPLRVWIAQGDSVDRWQASFAPVVRQAFATWEGVGLPVRFVFVDAPADAEVLVTWVPELPARRAGVLHWSGDADGWLANARLELATRVSDGTPADDASMRRIALHEIGHLLGLEHSADPADVMASWVTTSELTERDRVTARLLYVLPPGALAPGWDVENAS